MVLLLIAGGILECSLECILLLLLRDDLLQSCGLRDLVCVLLGAELHKGCLVDSLQGGHVRMLCRIVGICRGLNLPDV